MDVSNIFSGSLFEVYLKTSYRIYEVMYSAVRACIIALVLSLLERRIECSFAQTVAAFSEAV
jgi:hypothetical protein